METAEDVLRLMSSMSGVLAGLEPQRHLMVGEMIAKKEGVPPRKLYHYTSVAGVVGIIRSNHLWGTEAKALNDSTELTYGAGLLANELYALSRVSEPDVGKLLALLSSFYKEHGEVYRDFFKTYVVSFTEEPDLLSQWRAYADQARGCCIEFDFSDSRLFTVVSENTPWAIEILPVVYEEGVQRSLIQSGIERLLKYLDSTDWPIKRLANCSESERWTILGPLIHAFEPFVTAFKHHAFAEEKERRAVCSCARNLVTSRERSREIGSGPVCYMECIFLQEDDKDLWQRSILPITGIKFGPLAEDWSRKALLVLIQEQGYKAQVHFSQSNIPLRQ
jgi:hypothetical protein